MLEVVHAPPRHVSAQLCLTSTATHGAIWLLWIKTVEVKDKPLLYAGVCKARSDVASEISGFAYLPPHILDTMFCRCCMSYDDKAVGMVAAR